MKFGKREPLWCRGPRPTVVCFCAGGRTRGAAAGRAGRRSPSAKDVCVLGGAAAAAALRTEEGRIGASERGQSLSRLTSVLLLAFPARLVGFGRGKVIYELDYEIRKRRASVIHGRSEHESVTWATYVFSTLSFMPHQMNE